MLKVSVYNQQGKVVRQEKLDPEIFGLDPKKELIHQVVVSTLANQRHSFAHTKIRSEVRGGGRKPWRQKGTGRARAGSIRSPIWRGGGITFGPDKNRNYTQKINKKVKRQVFYMCLSDKVKEKRLYVLDKLTMSEIKTKKFAQILNKLVFKSKKDKKNRKVLLGLPEKDLSVIKSARNIRGLKTMPVMGLNTLDILKADYLLTTLKGIKKIQEHYKPHSVRKSEALNPKS